MLENLKGQYPLEEEGEEVEESSQARQSRIYVLRASS